MKKYFQWVNIARGIGMILVVLGHAADDTWVRSGNTNAVASCMIDFIYSFHMPLFFFLAGFCAVKLLDLRKFSEKKDYIVSRFCRLMIPYFTIGILYIPLKLLLKDEVTAKVEWSSLITGFFTGNNPNGQLWTLYALFILAVFFTIINRTGSKIMTAIAFSLTVISLLYDFNISIIQRSTYECLFFMLGILFNLYWTKKGEQTFTRKRAAAASFVCLILLIGIFTVKYIFAIDALKVLTALSGIMFVCMLSVVIEKYPCRILNIIGKYSMDIYILANIFQVLSRSIFLNRFHLPGIVCCTISVLLGIVMPVLLSKFIVRRFRILRILILGDFSRKEEKSKCLK